MTQPTAKFIAVALFALTFAFTPVPPHRTLNRIGTQTPQPIHHPAPRPYPPL